MIVLSALAMIVLGACGSVAGGTAGHPAGSPSPSPSASAGATPGPNLTIDDSGHTITLHPGQVISVSLKAPQGYRPWGNPSSSDQGVMEPTVNTGASAQVGWTLASFKALKDGSAKLESSTTMSCPAGVACPMLARAWLVTVQVTG
jgi:hypothetical protein